MSETYPIQENLPLEMYPIWDISITPEVINSPEWKELTKDSADKLNNLETQLTWTNLNVSRSEAFNMAKNSLNISDPLDFEQFTNQIKDFQRMYWLDVDGKIWKQTYMEMFKQRLLPKIDDSLASWKPIDETTKDDILFATKNPFGSNQTSIELMTKVADYKKQYWDKDKAFMWQIDLANDEWREVVINDPKVSKALSIKWPSWKTLWEDIMEKWFKEGLKGHWWEIKIVAIFAFLFWAIPWSDKLPGGGTWYWRIAWLIWGAYLWVDKVVESLLEKWWDLAWDVGNNIKERKKNYVTPKSLTELADKFWNSSTKVVDNLKKSYEWIKWDINDKNESQKDSKEYVKDLVIVSEAVNSDSKFMYTDISILEKVKWDINWIKWLFDDSSKIFPANLQWVEKNQREKDLVNYVNLILLQKNASEDILVRDLFYSKSILDTAIEEISKHNIWYINNTKADNEIKTTIWSISDIKIQNELISLLSNINTIEEWNNNNSKTKLDEYLKNNPSLPLDIKTKIQWIIAIFESEIVLEVAIKNISDIRLADSRTVLDSLDTINSKVALLEKVKSDLDKNTKKLAITDMSLFDITYDKKILELVEKWVELEGSNWWVYTNKIWEMKKKVELWKDLTTITISEKSILNIPTDKSTPKDFVKYYTDNSENINKINGLFDKYKNAPVWSEEEKFKNRVTAIINKYGEIKTNYEIVKADYVKKIAWINTKLNDLVITIPVDKAFIISSRTLLDEQLNEIDKISSEIFEWINYEKDIKKLWDKYINWVITIESPKNSFEYIDWIIPSETDRPEFTALGSSIKSKRIELESAYNVEQDIKNLDINKNNNTDLLLVISKISSDKVVIESFTDSIKEQKWKELEKIVLKLNNKYVLAINNESDLTKLAQIKSSYDELVKDKIVVNKIIDLLENNDLVKNAYEKRLKELEKNEFLEMNISNIPNKIIKEICTDFISIYEEEFVIQLDTDNKKEFARKIFNTDMKLGKFIENLNKMKDKNELWWDKLTSNIILEIKETLEKLGK